MTQKNRKRKVREPLSPQRIVDEALAIVDAEGLAGFSYRILAKRLHCEAMSLYHHFPSKNHLFDAMIDRCLAEVTFPDPLLDWVEQVRVVAHEWRDMALRHPGFFPFLAVHRLNTRFALSVLNRLLMIFEASGRETEWRAKQFRTIGYYLTGALLDETSGYAKGPTTATPVPGEEIGKSFPAVVAAGPFFAPNHHKDTFERGLAIHLDTLRREAKANVRTLR